MGINWQYVIEADAIAANLISRDENDWTVIIRPSRNSITIGCRTFDIQRLFEMSLPEIKMLSPNALEWWIKAKPGLYAFCKNMGYLDKPTEVEDIPIGAEW